jgi:importin subunit beta-1
MAATVCLMNIAKTVKDQIFDTVKLYIQTNVSKRSTREDWRAREAALTAFGCIVEGPNRSNLLPFANEAFVFLLQQGLHDEHPMVRRTTLWTLGRIFEFLHVATSAGQPSLVTAQNIGGIVDALLGAMQSSAGMAQKACYAVQALAEGFSPDEENHALTPHFAAIIEALFKVAYTEVAEHAATLHVTAFEAMHTVIQQSAQQSIELVTKMIPHLLSRIQETFTGLDNAQLPEETIKAISQRRSELQGQLCTALQVCMCSCTKPCAAVACAHLPVSQRVCGGAALGRVLQSRCHSFRSPAGVWWCRLRSSGRVHTRRPNRWCSRSMRTPSWRRCSRCRRAGRRSARRW